jgi:hypothetical protein
MDAIFSFFSRLLESIGISNNAAVSTGPAPAQVVKNVSLIIFNPITDQNRRLSEVMNWNDPDMLVEEFILDILEASHGYAKYQVAERFEMDSFPVLEDGFRYEIAKYMQHLQTMTGFHQPNMANYSQILEQFDLIQKINLGMIDEVWLMGFPYAGFYESRMVGNDAFWCNGSPIKNIDSCQRRFVIMGFNFERGLGEMLEDLGHRTESIMEYVFRTHSGEKNLWHRYMRHDKTAPGKAEVGSVHFAPNSMFDYDWGNPRQVFSRFETWGFFPDLSGNGRLVDCTDWGNGDIRLHHKWWLNHLPHVGGSVGSISNNWWKYIVDPNEVT